MNQNNNEINKISNVGTNLIRRQLKCTTRLVACFILNNIGDS